MSGARRCPRSSSRTPSWPEGAAAFRPYRDRISTPMVIYGDDYRKERLTL